MVERGPSGLEHRTGDKVVVDANPAGAASLRKFGNSVYSTLPVPFGGDTVAPFYLVSMPGEVKITHGVNV